MTTRELFEKHFGDQAVCVGLKHPNIEQFFNELNEECLLEDEKKIGQTIDNQSDKSN